MKQIAFLVLTFLGASLNNSGTAQTRIDFDSCYQFVSNTWSNYNNQVFELCLSQKINSYWNDSLASKKDIEFLKGLRLREYFDRSDSIVTDFPVTIIPFNPQTDFTGSRLYFRTVSGNTPRAVSYQLHAYAGTYSSESTGYWADNIEAFVIDAKDIYHSKLLWNPELLQSLISQRSILGDYRFKPVVNYRIYTGPKHLYDTTRFSETRALNCLSKEDTVLGCYNLYLFTEMARKHHENGGELYKDFTLNEKYDSSLSELAAEYSVVVSNPIDPDDPYDIIDTLIYVPFEFHPFDLVEVVQAESDYIISLVITNKLNQTERRICYSFKELSGYMTEPDKIVLTELLTHYSK